jgi:hypothetical protein
MPFRRDGRRELLRPPSGSNGVLLLPLSGSKEVIKSNAFQA